MARISIDRVWRETQSQVRAHLSAFATLTAAFVFLPALLFGLLVPQGMQGFTLPAPGTMPHFPPWFWPAALVGVVLQSLVTLTIAAIAGDAARPTDETVGQTLARMLPALLRYLGALVVLFFLYLLLLIPISLVLMLVLGAVSALGGDAVQKQAMLVGGLIALLLVPVLLWVAGRLAPMVGVFAVEGAAPVTGIRRAWRLSSGSGWRIALLIFVTSFAAILVALAVQGVAAALGSGAALAGAHMVARIVVAVVSAAINGALFVLFSAGLGVIYRQLREG